MVRTIIYIILSTIISSCSYVLLPVSYYNKYATIISKTNNYDNLDYYKAYVIEDTIKSNIYNKLFHTNIKSYTYIFFYQNNTTCSFSSPLGIKNDKPFGVTVNEVADSIKNGFFERNYNLNKINWDYYEIQNNKIIIYDFDYNISSGANILTKVNTIQNSFLKIKNDFINEDCFNKNKDSSIRKYNLFMPSSLNIKPDSSKSRFLKAYNIYITKGKRRHYPYYKDFEKYINKK